MSNTSSKLFHGKFIRIMAANTLSAFSFYMISTLLSTFLTERGIRLSIAGIIIGLFSITALLIRPICGILSDSCNKILLIRIAAIIMTAGLFGYTLTSSVPLLNAEKRVFVCWRTAENFAKRHICSLSRRRWSGWWWTFRGPGCMQAPGLHS